MNIIVKIDPCTFPLNTDGLTVTDDRIDFHSKIVGKAYIRYDQVTSCVKKPSLFGVIQLIIGVKNYKPLILNFNKSDYQKVEIAFNYITERCKIKGFEYNELMNTEIRKKCLVCGKIFCYTPNDVKKNMSNNIMSAIGGVGTVAGAVGGNYMAANVNNNNANYYADKVIDYSRCPNCGSSQLKIISEEDVNNSQDDDNRSISSADEILKYKQLLDQGIITQEEFDLKKKQLLGL